MEIRSGIHKYGPRDHAELLAQLAGYEWYVYPIPEGIVDRATFMRIVSDVLPLCPTLIGGLNWDAWSDSIWGGLDQLGAPKVAVVFPDLRKFRRQQPDNYEIAMGVLQDLVSGLENPCLTRGRPVQLAVFLADFPNT